MDVPFSSLNPYQSLEVIIADSPQALVLALKEIKTPFKILGFFQVGNRSGAYVMGDIRIKTKSKPNEVANGSDSKKKVSKS